MFAFRIPSAPKNTGIPHLPPHSVRPIPCASVLTKARGIDRHTWGCSRGWKCSVPVDTGRIHSVCGWVPGDPSWAGSVRYRQ